MSEWQPIETAPKDGTRVLLFSPSHDVVINTRTFERKLFPSRVGEGLWTDESMDGGPVWCWANDSCNCCWGEIGMQPTRWMPLPEGPSE